MFSYKIETVAITAAILLFATTQQSMASGFIHFKPNNGDKVLVNEPVIVNGTSAPSNNTRVGCTVSMNVNSAGYQPTKAMGAGGMNDYTKWSTTTPPMKPGVNELEAQFQCFKPGTVGGVSFTHHLVHNVTSTTTLPIPNHTHSNHTSTQPTTVISPPTVG